MAQRQPTKAGERLARRVRSRWGAGYVCSACRLSVASLDAYCRSCGVRFTGTDR